MTMGPIEGQLTERDFLGASRLHVRPRLPFALLGVFLLGATGVMIWKTHSLETSGVLAFFIVCIVAQRWINLRNFRQNKALHEPFTLTLRDDGVSFKRINGEGVVPWDHIRFWRANDKLILIYPSRNMYYLVPRHLFRDDDDFAAFKQSLTERVGRPR